MDEMNIYERMSAATMEIQRVAKNLRVDAGKSSYKAVGEADILEAVKPVEAKYRIYSYPADREIIESGTLTSESTYNGQPKKTERLFMRERVVYRFVNLDKPEEYVEMVSYGDGLDSGDKAPGKAATYADKYALMKAYKITTGDDPDQHASEPLISAENNTPMATERQINYLKSLGAKDSEKADVIRKRVKSWERLTKYEANKLINELA